MSCEFFISHIILYGFIARYVFKKYLSFGLFYIYLKIRGWIPFAYSESSGIGIILILNDSFQFTTQLYSFQIKLQFYFEMIRCQCKHLFNSKGIYNTLNGNCNSKSNLYRNCVRVQSLGQIANSQEYVSFLSLGVLSAKRICNRFCAPDRTEPEIAPWLWLSWLMTKYSKKSFYILQEAPICGRVINYWELHRVSVFCLIRMYIQFRIFKLKLYINIDAILLITLRDS